jgi:hypothetical protein
MSRLSIYSCIICLIGSTLCLCWSPMKTSSSKLSLKDIRNTKSNLIRNGKSSALHMSETPSELKEMPIGYVKSEEVDFTEDMTDEWELDVYSRPVMNSDNKKLWEILITDSAGSFRYLKTIPSNLVNSRNLRNAVEEIMESAPVRPKIIRFFRNPMFNMITIALSTLEIEVKPSRRTHNMFSWYVCICIYKCICIYMNYIYIYYIYM